MTQRRPYAGAITKDYLIKLGITGVSKDGFHVWKNGVEVPLRPKRSGKKYYMDVEVYDPEIRANTPEEERNNSTGQFPIGVHILNYVWNVEDKPLGMVIHHKNNLSIDNRLENLKMVTQAENLAEEREASAREIPCKLDRPLSHYEDKLKMYKEKYEEAKRNHDAALVKKLRSNTYTVRGQIRYWLSHQEEAERLIAVKAALEANNKSKKRAYHKKADTIKELKAKIKNARMHFKAAKEEYGADDLVVLQLKSEWKLAIYDLNKYLADNYLTKTSFSSENEE